MPSWTKKRWGHGIELRKGQHNYPRLWTLPALRTMAASRADRFQLRPAQIEATKRSFQGEATPLHKKWPLLRMENHAVPKSRLAPPFSPWLLQVRRWVPRLGAVARFRRLREQRTAAVADCCGSDDGSWGFLSWKALLTRTAHECSWASEATVTISV